MSGCPEFNSVSILDKELSFHQRLHSERHFSQDTIPKAYPCLGYFHTKKLDRYTCLYISWNIFKSTMQMVLSKDEVRNKCPVGKHEMPVIALLCIFISWTVAKDWFIILTAWLAMIISSEW